MERLSPCPGRPPARGRAGGGLFPVPRGGPDMNTPTPATTTATAPPRMRSRVAVASLIGTTIEGYDFVLYGLAAATVFGPLFFAPADPLVGTMAAFATYAVGFIARPIGGILGGHYGDRIGRKTVLVASLLLTGLATTAIGLLPTHDTAGWIAPAL